VRVERFALRGFTRFRELVTVDLAELPPGLIAIVGENGAGKTTLLEAAPAALYRSFLSRGDLVGYATERDSYLEVQCAVEGLGVFRARVNVDGPRRGSDAVIEMLRASGEPEPLNDGKVSTYDQVIAETFPSKALLLASAFASQNKAGSFISLDKKARKTLFMQLLGIERYQTMSDTARQAAALVEQAIGRLEAVHAELTREDPDVVLAQLDAEAHTLDAQVDGAEAERARVKQTVDRLEARLVALQDAR
jgi:DNA repair protein SbcC/Rad50